MSNPPAAELLPKELTSLLQLSLPETTTELAEQIRLIEQAQADLLARTKELLASEDPVNDIFHAEEIHALRQERIMLETHKDFRKLRLNRLQGRA